MYTVHTNPAFSLEQEKKANDATKIYDNPLSSMIHELHEESVPYISTYTQASDSSEQEETYSSDGSQTSEEENSFDKTSADEEEIPMINMATEAEVVHPDDTEDEGETSGASRTQRTNFPKAKGVEIFTMDDIPAEKWEAKFQDFHAWMIAQNLTEESHFEILSVFTANLSGILKDWWSSLGEQDKMYFLTRQDFSENINILHLMFIGDVKESKETKRKEFFQMKCLSYD